MIEIVIFAVGVVFGIVVGNTLSQKRAYHEGVVDGQEMTVEEYEDYQAYARKHEFEEL